MRNRVLVTLCFVAVMSLGASASAFAARVQIWGSTTCQKRFLEPGAEALKAATGVDVKVLGVGTGKGLIGLIEGKAPASAASEDLEGAIRSAQKAAKKSGKDLSIPDNLVYHEIARDVIIPIVHKDNPVSSLSWAQLRDIHTGKIRNWNEMGGPDRPIQVITSHAGSATRAVFQKLVMEKDEYASGAIVVKSTRQEIDEVSKNPGAIGAVSESFVKLNPGKTKPVRTDPISRPLGLITRGPPNPSVQAVIDYFQSGGGRTYLQ